MSLAVRRSGYGRYYSVKPFGADTACDVGTTVMPTVVMPSDLRAYVAEIDADMRIFDIDVKASTVSDAWKQAWADKLAAFVAFREDIANTSTAVLALTTRAKFEQADRYACTLKQLRQDFRARGGMTNTPDPIRPGQPGGTQIDWGAIKNVIYVVAGLYAVSVVAPIVSPVLKAASERTAKKVRASK